MNIGRSTGIKLSKLSRSVLHLLVIGGAGLIFVAAQGPNTGTVRGKIADIQGSLIVGAQAVLAAPNGEQRTAQSNRDGEFVFRDLPAGTYGIQVTHPGFARYDKTDIILAAGRAVSLEIILGVTIEETQVTVEDEPAVSTDPAAAAGAIVLKEKEIEALPDNPDELDAALRALAGPGAGPSGGEIFIDGFSGGRLPPRDTIREIRINQNPFSSEYDRLGLGRIEILTKPGTDDYRGEVEFEFEDESFNSRNPFASNRAPFQVRTIEGNFAGPIIKKRASFFVDAGHEHTDNNSLINAFVLDPALNVVPLSVAVVTPNSEIEFSPRFDLQLDERNTLVARYFFELNKFKNAGLGGFDLPSRAYSSKSSDHTIRLTETAVLSPTVINELRFQFLRRSTRQESDDPSPTIRVLDAFTGGGANIGNAFANEQRLELQNLTSIARGRHVIKFGLRLRHVVLEDSSPSNFAGTFTFSSINQYRNTILNVPGAFPTQFTIAGGNPEAGVKQTDVGLFVQDDWRVRPELTLSFGLRYERQTNISSNADFAPRFAIAYAPGASSGNKPKMVFRGGFGVFYERFGEGLTLQTNRFDGVNQQQFIVTDPAILDTVIFTQQNTVSNVPPIESLSSLPQTTRVVSPTLRSPYTVQAALGVERQLPFNTTVSASFVHSRTRRLLRSRNINAPINGVRPDPDGGNVFQYESTGRFDQNQLILNFRSNFVDGISIFGNYAFGKARSDSDGAGTFPANSYDLSGEYGDAAIDVRHRFVIGANFEIPFGIGLNPFITFRSGAPFNITTGIDNNGDDVFTDRPAFATDLNRQCNFGTDTNPNVRPCVVQTPFGNFDLQPIPGQTIIPRNYGEGPSFFMVNLRATKEFEFGRKKSDRAAASGGAGGGGGGRGPGRGGVNDPFAGGGGGGRQGGDDDDESPYKIELTMAVRNLFNWTNKGTPIGNLLSPFFGESVSSAGGFGFGGGGSPSAGNRRIEFEIEFSF